MTKLCVGASSGGHMAELDALLLVSHHWPTQPQVFISTLEQMSDQSRSGTCYSIGECNRNTPLAAMMVIMRSLRIVIREQPDVVVTTGSLPLALFSIVAWLFRTKIIWIDSISQVDALSMSGRLVKPFASAFFVQWPALAEQDSSVQYAGELV